MERLISSKELTSGSDNDLEFIKLLCLQKASTIETLSVAASVIKKLESSQSIPPFPHFYTSYCHLYLFIRRKDRVVKLTNSFYDYIKPIRNEEERSEAFEGFKEIINPRDLQFCLHNLRKKCSTEAWEIPEESYNVTHFANSMFINDTFHNAAFKGKLQKNSSK